MRPPRITVTIDSIPEAWVKIEMLAEYRSTPDPTNAGKRVISATFEPPAVLDGGDEIKGWLKFLGVLRG